MTLPRLAPIMGGLLLLSAGCGSLRVKVDVLEPTVVEGELDRLLLRDSLPQILAQSDQALHERFAELQNTHFTLISKLADEYRAEAAKLSGGAKDRYLIVANGLTANFAPTRGPFYRDEEAAVLALNQKIRQLKEKLGVAAAGEQPPLRAELAAALRERQFRLENVDRVVRENVGPLLAKGRSDLPRLADVRTALDTGVPQAADALADARRSLIAGQGIVESPYAYVVAAAPEEKWSPRFNETFATGQLGNLNVGIKMVSLGDFTLKGVTFDPSDVARAISKVTVQALVMAAQVYGVPIKPPAAGTSGQPPAAGAALAASSGRLGDVQDAAAAREAKLQGYRSALVTIGLAITREQSKLAGSDAERKAAIDAIAATYEAHKSRLSLSSLLGETK